MRVGNAKGSVLFHLRRYIVERHGEKGWQEVLSRLPPEDVKVLSGILMVGAWYPVGIWNRTLDRYLTANYPDPMAAMMDLARYIAREDLNLVYKMFLKVGTPGFIMGRSGSIWSRYYDSGRLQPTEIRPRQWRIELDAPINEDAAPSIYTCEGVCAWLSSAVKLTGSNLTILQTRCRFKGSAMCEYEASF